MDTAARAEKYYQLIGQKDVNCILPYLHPDVKLYSPLAKVEGKEAVVQATSRFMDAINSLTIHAKFGSADQAVIVYEVDMPGIGKEFPGTSWIRFHNDQIIRIQLFYDGSPFSVKKEEIFSKG